jgi:hypothetical protein
VNVTVPVGIKEFAELGVIAAVSVTGLPKVAGFVLAFTAVLVQIGVELQLAITLIAAYLIRPAPPRFWVA